MFAKRVIPCLDVDRGRVVKGTNFLNLRDAGDPVAVAARVRGRRGRRAGLPRHHRQPRGPRDHARRRPPHGGSRLHAADRRRRHPHASTTSAPCSNAGADKVSINSAACRDPEFVRQAARRFGSQCIVVNIDPKRVHAATAARCGKSTSTAAGSAPASRPSPGPARSSSSGPAKSCSPPWMPTARKTVTIWRSPAPWRRPSACRSWPAAGPAARAPGRRHPAGRGRGGPGRQHFPFRRVYDPADEANDARPRHPGATLKRS